MPRTQNGTATEPLTIVVLFVKDRETKNKVRYEEVATTVIGSLYVDKAQAAQLGDRLEVAIREHV